MGKGKHDGAETELDLEGMSIEELRRRVQKGRELLAQLEGLFPGMVTMTAEERLHSDGRLRNGESAELTAVLDAVDSAPQYFTSLADKDEGRDPTKFETGLLRERLVRRDLLNEL